MHRTANSRPPGWYQDARDPDLLCWWDGEAWTEHRGPRHGVAVDGPLPAIRARTASQTVVGPAHRSRYLHRRIAARRALPSGVVHRVPTGRSLLA